MTDREKEIKRLLYIKSELIRQTKKEMKTLREELDSYYGQKKLVRDKQKHRK